MTDQKNDTGAYAELAKTEDGWHWLLWSANNRPIAMSPKPYTRRNDAMLAMLRAGNLIANPQLKMMSPRIQEGESEHQSSHRSKNPELDQDHNPLE